MTASLTSSPIEGTTQPESIGHYDWKLIRRIALGHRGALFKAHVVAILATLASVPVPLLLPLLVDEVLLEQPGPVLPLLNAMLPEAWHGPLLYIGMAVLAALVLRLAALGLNVLQGLQFATLSKDVVFRIRSHLLERLRRISMAEYELMGSGAVASRFVTDLNTIDQFIGTALSRFLVALLTILGTALVLLWMHWKLALLILLLNPVVIYFTTRLGKKVKEMKRRENAALEAFQGALTETLDAIQQLRASNREGHYLQRLTDRARQVRDYSLQHEWRSDTANRFSFTVFQFGVDAFRATAMLTVLFSDLSIGQMFAVFGYLWFMMGPVQELLGMQYSYYAASAALGRINDLLALDNEPSYPPLKNPFQGSQTIGIELRDIHFAYGEGAEVLRGVNLRIEPGEKVALVGASGGGKSTLVQVILGLYTPTRGQVLFNGIPLEQIGMEQVREHVATVLQHPALFNDTVRANLCLGRDHKEADLWQALEIAQLDELVRTMPQGLDTVVGRQGVRLSGGQRQRLAIARMVLANPQVVILDEATSALDAETEYQLHQALQRFLRQRTTLIIAHRLSAVKQADRVYVFEGGQVAEEGRHEELLAQGGLYAQLYGERQR